MSYVYNGEVHIFQEDLDHFLMIAQKLRLQGLLSSDDESEPDLKDETLKEATKNEMFSEPPVTTQRQPIARTTSHLQSISKTSVLNEELETLDERINEQIERDQDGNFRCRMCGKTTSSKHTKKNIEYHVETHFEGLSFPCSMCPSVLRSRQSLASHIYRHKKN